LLLGGLGFGVIASKVFAQVDLSDALALSGVFYSMARSFASLEPHCEGLEKITGGMCKRRARRTALNGILADFDLPYRSAS